VGGANRWPVALDDRDPKGIASFCLGLGYHFDTVVNTVVERCNLDRITAVRIVSEQAQQQGGR
jgi:hypothetical protein